MSQSNFGLKGLKTGAGISAPLRAYSRVKQDAAADANGFTGTVTLAGPQDEAIGNTEQQANAVGDHVTVKLRNYPGTRKVICASTCSIGDRLYPTVNGQVDTRVVATGLGTAGGVLGPCEYIAVDVCATAGGVVEAIPVAFTGRGLLFSQTSDSATVTNTTTETTFTIGQYTIPANTLKVGDVLKIKARVVIPASNSTDTLTTKLYAGTVVLATVPAFDPAASNDEVFMDATFTITALGATGKIQGNIGFTAGILGTATQRSLSLQSTTLDTTAAELLKVTATWSVANAGNQAILRDFVVELVRQ